ncbi:hypothetical protein SAMN05443270_4208 [Lacrimispora sphenoides]|jgi:hypothetical protein|uniref:hypothetical protein n=1 Tax=Lacrimispora sphenoides TaxID=29370 RepID=UPI0008C22C19|nr:hypothetical protein [Lacrimispora sphenoides]SEU26765.1 hypothetical protein SAMN05443270_4208 [Lacrimispora sphenoides]
MKLIVRQKLKKYIVYDENNSVIGEWKQSYFKGAKMEFLDMGGKILYTVKKCGNKIKIKGNDGFISECRFQYAQDENGNIVQKGLFRPPMAEKSVLASGDIVIVQDKQREFTIFLNGIEAGKMTHMMSLRKQLITDSYNISTELCCIIFILGIYMLHDDDIEIV